VPAGLLIVSRNNQNATVYSVVRYARMPEGDPLKERQYRGTEPVDEAAAATAAAARPRRGRPAGKRGVPAVEGAAGIVGADGLFSEDGELLEAETGEEGADEEVETRRRGAGDADNVASIW
jgi:hypothetical protein